MSCTSIYVREKETGTTVAIAIRGFPHCFRLQQQQVKNVFHGSSHSSAPKPSVTVERRYVETTDQACDSCVLSTLACVYGIATDARSGAYVIGFLGSTHMTKYGLA